MQFLPATFAAHARPVPPAALTRPARTIRSTPSTPPPATSAPPAPAAAPTCPPRSTPTTTPASASPTSWPRPPPTPAPTAPARTLPAATPGQEHRPRPPAPRSITPGHSWARPIAAVASAVPAYPLEASRARRAGSFDSGPPASFATPTSASEAPRLPPARPGRRAASRSGSSAAPTLRSHAPRRRRSSPRRHPPPRTSATARRRQRDRAPPGPPCPLQPPGPLPVSAAGGHRTRRPPTQQADPGTVGRPAGTTGPRFRASPTAARNSGLYPHRSVSRPGRRRRRR